MPVQRQPKRRGRSSSSSSAPSQSTAATTTTASCASTTQLPESLPLARPKHLYRSPSRLKPGSPTYAPFGTVIEPRLEPCGFRPLALPHPTRPPIRQFVLALQPVKHVVTQSIANNDSAHQDGAFLFRFHSVRIHKLRLNAPSSSSTSSSAISPLHSPTSSRSSPSSSTMGKSASSRNKYSHVQLSSSTNNTARTMLLNDPITIMESVKPTRSSTYKIRYDRSARFEVKRQGKTDSYQASFDDTQYGNARLTYTPAKKFSFGFTVKQPVPKYSKSFTNETENRKHKHDVSNNTSPSSPSTSHVDTMTVSPADIEQPTQTPMNKKNPFTGWRRWVTELPSTILRRHQGSQAVRGSTQLMNGGHLNGTTATTTPITNQKQLKNTRDIMRTNDDVRPFSSGEKKSKSKSTPYLIPHTRALRMEADYAWKDKRWTFVTGIDGREGRELSLRLLNKPWRLIPRLRTPIILQQKPHNKTNTRPAPPWLCWMPEIGRSWPGQVQVGWGDFAISNVWDQGTVTIAQRKKDGSGFAASLGCKDKSGKFEKTIVKKALKGKLGLTINGMMGNQKDQTGIAISLHDGKSTVSAYGRTSKTFGLSTDSSFHVGHNFCRVALRTEDLKSMSVRLGWFY